MIALTNIFRYFLVTQMIFRFPMAVNEASSIVSKIKFVSHAVDSVSVQTIHHYSAHTAVSVEARIYNQAAQ